MGFEVFVAPNGCIIDEGIREEARDFSLVPESSVWWEWKRLKSFLTLGWSHLGLLIVDVSCCCNHSTWCRFLFISGNVVAREEDI